MKTDKHGLYESEDKMVSHPSHYQSKYGIEVIDVIEAFTEGLEGIEAADTANIIKYACRWKDKNGIQDLEKILWYTQHLITHLKSKDATSKISISNDGLHIRGKYIGVDSTMYTGEQLTLFPDVKQNSRFMKLKLDNNDIRVLNVVLTEKEIKNINSKILYANRDFKTDQLEVLVPVKEADLIMDRLHEKKDAVR